MPIKELLRKPLILATIGIAVSLLAALLVLFLLLRSVSAPMANLESEDVYLLEPGSSLTRVANDLESRGHLDSAFALRLAARWQGIGGAIQSGEYQLQPGMSAQDLLNDMVNGRTIQYRVTVVEGWTLAQALAAIQNARHVEQQLAAGASYREIAVAMGLDIEHPEGQIFPDTYFYTRGTSDIELLRRGHERLQEVLNSAWDNRLGALPYESPYDALIMASIIEKESAASSERGHIAGVFIRRLEQGMRLQSDPTVIYGLGDEFDGNLTRVHLQTTTDYNTYRINGLPPTPIALAGRDSIEASLNPLPSDYLYFVSRGDGSHQFSSTLEEHNAAVNQYQRQGGAQQDQ